LTECKLKLLIYSEQLIFDVIVNISLLRNFHQYKGVVTVPGFATDYTNFVKFLNNFFFNFSFNFCYIKRMRYLHYVISQQSQRLYIRAIPNEHENCWWAFIFPSPFYELMEFNFYLLNLIFWYSLTSVVYTLLFNSKKYIIFMLSKISRLWNNIY